MTQAFGAPIGQQSGRNVYRLPTRPLQDYSSSSVTLEAALKQLVIISQQAGVPLTPADIVDISSPQPVSFFPGSNTVAELTLASGLNVVPDPAGQFIAYQRHTINTEFTGSQWETLDYEDAIQPIFDALYLPWEAIQYIGPGENPGNFRRSYDIDPAPSNRLIYDTAHVIIPDQIAD